MKLAVFTAPGKIEIVEGPKPALSGSDEVLIRIERVGVCGSDVHFYRDGRIGNAVLEYPATLGHECAGTVVEVGSPHPQPLSQRARGVNVGDRVAIDPAIGCSCDQCLIGRENTCRKIQFMGSPGEAPGAAAEFCAMPAKNCFPVADSVSLETATLVEPLSIGLHAVRLGEIRPGASVGIFGAGPIGLSMLLCLKATVPSCTAFVTEPIESRRKAAESCGADWTGDSRNENIERMILDKRPHGLNAVFECSGDPAAVDFGMRLLSPGGTLLLVGIPPVDRIGFEIHSARRKELTFKNVRRQKGCTAAVIELIESGRMDPRRMLTHRFPLERIADAFDLVEGYRDGVIKAIIEI
jgi:L-iditol 2-dehydrogenase